MSDRRPENPKLIVEYQKQTCTCSEPDWCNRNGARYRTAQREATSADLIAEIRSEVESGTIKGEVVEASLRRGTQWREDSYSLRVDRPGVYIVIGPVSDGGEDA